MKFTEEQYQNIVRTYKSSSEYISSIRLVLDYIDELNSLSFEKALAIANPLTREWAHDKFVEKEKKYYWKLNGLYLIKDRLDGSIIFDSYKNLFTESEIKAWGYNPEMFDREEV